MPVTARRGVSLVEALVALVLTAALTLTALAALSSLQRQGAVVSVRGQAAATALAALQLLRAELAAVDPQAGDLLAVSPERLVYRAVRGSGVTCGERVDGLLVRTASWRSLRLPSPGRDSILVLRGPAGWEAHALQAPGRAATCPDGGAALLLPVASAGGWAGQSVVRMLEVMELRVYQSDGQAWLGQRSVTAGETIQPVLGPLVGGRTAFTPLGEEGRRVSVPSEARELLVDLRVLIPGLRPDASGHPGRLDARVPLGGGPAP